MPTTLCSLHCDKNDVVPKTLKCLLKRHMCNIVLVDWLIPTLHKSIRKLLCFNMCQLDITMDWAKERNTITNQNRYSRNNNGHRNLLEERDLFRKG
jgi:hypothetical protein